MAGSKMSIAKPSQVPVAEQPEDVDIDRVVGELGGQDAYLLLYRKDETSLKMKYRGKIEAARFTIEDVRREHGGGSYQFRLFDTDGRYKRCFTQDIDGPPHPIGNGASPVATAPQATELLIAMLNSQANLVTALASSAMRPPPAPPVSIDPLMALAKAAEVIRSLMPVPVPHREPPPLADALALIKEGMELGRASTGEGGGDGFGKVMEPLSKFLDLLKMQAARGAIRPAAPVADGRSPVTEEPEQIVGGPVLPINRAPEGTSPLALVKTGMDWLEPLKPHLASLEPMAAMGADPEDVATTIYNAMPDQVLDRMKGVAVDPAFVEDLLGAVPSLASRYPEWSRSVAVELHRSLTEEEPAGGDAEPDEPDA